MAPETFDLAESETEVRDISLTLRRLPEPVDLGDEAEVLRLTNIARAAGQTCGSSYYPPVKPLAMDMRLSSAARRHSLSMASFDFFNHFFVVDPYIRVRAAGFQDAYGNEITFMRPAVGENLTAGRSRAEDAVNAWLASPGHCANLHTPLRHPRGDGSA